MCTETINVYTCGHWKSIGLVPCLTRRVKGKGQCDGYKKQEHPIDHPCDRDECIYVDKLKKGWVCCKCRNGPNHHNTCHWPFIRDSVIRCGHSMCKGCGYAGNMGQAASEYM